MSRARELLAALMHAHVGGFLTQPPGLDGQSGLGLVAIHGVPRARMWDAVASARAPALTGKAVTFVALRDGSLIVNEDIPADSLTPLADAIEATLSPPYRAAGVRTDSDIWAAAAQAVSIVEIRLDEGALIDLSVVDGIRELAIDGKRTIRPIAALDALAAERGDVSIHAERVDGHLFAVDVFQL